LKNVVDIDAVSVYKQVISKGKQQMNKYTLGGTHNSKLTGKLIVQAPRNAIEGWRAFARIEKTGKYREVFGLSQEDNTWIQGVNEGFWFHHTHDSREQAIELASRAYRWINK
jgi:hypothetical protein